MNDDAGINTSPPSDVQSSDLAPFAGRIAARAYLYQYLTDAHYRHGIAVVGARGSGKSALLHNFESFFDEAFIAVPLALNEMVFENETELLIEMARRAAIPLAQREFTIERIPPAPDDESMLRTWFEHDYLPMVFTLIRSHRRIVYLVDDADVLVDVVMAGKLPGDLIAFLHHILETFAQLHIVVTIDAGREDDLHHLKPLVSTTESFRLTHLTANATAELLRMRDDPAYHITDEAVTMVYDMTGGEPQITQRMAAHLYQRYLEGQFTLTADDVRGATQAVYAESVNDLRYIWQQMSHNEHLVLVAMTSFIYDNPLKSINDDAIADWLLESDYLLDRTAVKAAIRSLEYREIVHSHDGLKLSSSMMRTWLLEHAQLDDSAVSQSSMASLTNSRWMLTVIILVVVIVIGLILLIIGSDAAPVNDIAPTVTLPR